MCILLSGEESSTQPDFPSVHTRGRLSSLGPLSCAGCIRVSRFPPSSPGANILAAHTPAPFYLLACSEPLLYPIWWPQKVFRFSFASLRSMGLCDHPNPRLLCCSKPLDADIQPRAVCGSPWHVLRGETRVSSAVESLVRYRCVGLQPP